MQKPTTYPFAHQHPGDSMDWLLKRLREHEENERNLAVELERMRIENRTLKQNFSAASKQKSDLENEVLRLKEAMNQMNQRQQTGQREYKPRGIEASMRIITRR